MISSRARTYGVALALAGWTLGCSAESSKISGSGGSGSGGAAGAPATGLGGALAGSGGGVGAGGNATGTGGVRGGVGGASGGVDGGAPDSGGADARTPTLPSTGLAVRFANAVMTRWPDPMSIAGAGNVWDYNHGIVLRGMEQVYRYTSDVRYLTYIQRYADEFVSAAGVVNIPVDHSFDNIQPSVLLPFLYQRTGTAKYRTAADQVRARYDTIPRNPDRGFWHKSIYPNQMWLDSIYMGEPFLARYGATFGTCGTFCADTAVEQMTLISAHVRDTATGLLYHAWDDSPAGTAKAPWADPTTGRSPIVWSRALGWYAMALVDIMQDLPANHPGRAQLLPILAGLATAVRNTQDPATGLWFQVVDMGTRTDNWIETSGSGMFVYALKVGVKLGYIDAGFLTVANRGWDGLKTKVTSDAGTGLPTFSGAVKGMGVQVDYANYINQLPTLSNSAHGLCAILLAAAEMEAQ